jgi:hypothetical protein
MSAIRTIIFLTAGKLDFRTINPHADRIVPAQCPLVGEPAAARVRSRSAGAALHCRPAT